MAKEVKAPDHIDTAREYYKEKLKAGLKLRAQINQIEQTIIEARGQMQMIEGTLQSLEELYGFNREEIYKEISKK